MAAASSIAWTHATFNPWIGCTKISPACDRCYAQDWAKHYAQDVTWGEPGTHAKHRRTAESTWAQPKAWNKALAKKIAAQRDMLTAADLELFLVFCASLADWADTDVPRQWQADLFKLIRETPLLTYLLLTKRPQNAFKVAPPDFDWKSVWVGCTVENREEMLRRGPHLAKIPARVRFWSCEPLLGNLGTIPPEIMPDWVIIGGESGPGFRQLDMQAVADLRVQLRDAGVPVFFKQDSSLKPGCKGRASDALWATKQFPKVSHV